MHSIMHTALDNPRVVNFVMKNAEMEKVVMKAKFKFVGFGVSCALLGSSFISEAQSFRAASPLYQFSQVRSVAGGLHGSPSRVVRGSAEARLMEFLKKNRSSELSIPLGALNHQILAQSAQSPLTIVQRIQLAALAMHQTWYRHGRDTGGAQFLQIPPEELCYLFEASSEFQNGSYDKDDDELARELLYGRRGCGSGEIRNVSIQLEGSMSYRVDINLGGKLKAVGGARIFTTQDRSIGSVIGEGTYQTSTLRMIANIFSDRNALSSLQSVFRRDYLSYDVEAGLHAILDAARNEADPDQVKRVLENFPTVTFRPHNSSTALRVAPRSTPWSRDVSEIQVILYTRPLAHRGSKVEDGFERFVLALDQAESWRSSDLAISGGKAKLLPDSFKLDFEWNAVAHHTLTSAFIQIDEHLSAIDRTGVGTMYGPASAFAALSEEKQAEFLRNTKRVSGDIPTPVKTSCIGFVLKHLSQGYMAAGKAERWNEIESIVRDNSGQGTYLLRELKKDGWKLVYFNPDKLNPTERVDEKSKEADHHLWTWYLARDSKGYMTNVLSYGKVFEGLKLDYVATDYRVTDPSVTEHNEAAARLLQEAPFYVGIANGGYHVYLGSKGMVVESHSTRGPSNRTNVEVRPFNQWGLFPQESFLSGVIAVPPGQWSTGLSERFIK